MEVKKKISQDTILNLCNCFWKQERHFPVQHHTYKYCLTSHYILTEMSKCLLTIKLSFFSSQLPNVHQEQEEKPENKASLESKSTSSSGPAKEGFITPVHHLHHFPSVRSCSGRTRRAETCKVLNPSFSQLLREACSSCLLYDYGQWTAGVGTSMSSLGSGLTL